MKAVFVVLLGLSFVLCSCEQNKKKSYEQEYSDLANSQMKSGNTPADIFLGFRFGDTRRDVSRKLSALLKDKKIYLDQSRSYAYDMQFDTSAIFSKAAVHLDFKYYNDSLYNLTLTGEPSERFTGSKTSQIYVLNLQKFYGQKYGYGDWLMKENEVTKDIENMVKIMGNCEINIFTADNHFYIAYTDLRKSRLINDQKNNYTRQAVDKTKKDI